MKAALSGREYVVARGGARSASSCLLLLLCTCGPAPAQDAPRPAAQAQGPRAAPSPKPTATPAAPIVPGSKLGLDGRSVPSAAAGAQIGFLAMLGERALPDGLRIEPSSKDPTHLGVRDETGGYHGTLELIAYGAGDLTGELDAHYFTFAQRFYAELEADRATEHDPSYRMAAEPPELVRIGRLRGLRYGFSEYRGKTLTHRTLAHAFVQGAFMHVITASAPGGQDADAGFSSLDQLDKFEPHLSALMASLQVPAP